MPPHLAQEFLKEIMCISVLNICVCTRCMFGCPWRSERGLQLSRNGVTNCCKSLYGCWEQKPGPLEEQPVSVLPLWTSIQLLLSGFFSPAGSCRQFSLKARNCSFVLGPNSGSAQKSPDQEESISSYQYPSLFTGPRFIGSDLKSAAKPYSRFP